MAGWHHQLDGHEFEWTLGDGDGQGGLVCCNSWGCKELDMTEWLNFHFQIFHRLQGWILSSFWLLLSKVGPVVCVSTYKIRFVLSFCLFVFPLMGKAEWGGNPVCWWLGLYFCFVYCLDVLHRVLLVAGWCWVLYYSGFLCVISHYLITPRVSSPVV